MELEIKFQPRVLANLPLYKPRDQCIFAGSGDSYAAALAVQMASGRRALSCHPLDFVERPNIARGKTIFLISVSGRTLANINAAKAVRKVARSVAAVTSSPPSPLAKICERAINLDFRSSGVTTSGTISFTASLITCLSLAMRTKAPGGLGSLLRKAGRQAEIAANRMAAVSGAFYILGDGILFPVALYGSLKLNEVLGAKAFAYTADEFGHAPIFSARSTDGIIILGRESDSRAGLEKTLKAEGLNVARTSAPDQTEIAALLYASFFLQVFALRTAQLRRFNECYFVRKKSLLKASSNLIY